MAGLSLSVELVRQLIDRLHVDRFHFRTLLRHRGRHYFAHLTVTSFIFFNVALILLLIIACLRDVGIIS